MPKQALFLHGAGPQGPTEGSGPFAARLKADLGPGFDLSCPIMPSPEEPDYAPWKAGLDEAFRPIRGEAILIGHSLGGSVLLKYLSEEEIAFRIPILCIVAAPFWGSDPDWHYEGFKLRDDFADRLPGTAQIWFYHAKDDPVVPIAHLAHYASKLPRANVCVLDGDDHLFAGGLPALVEKVKAI